MISPITVKIFIPDFKPIKIIEKKNRNLNNSARFLFFLKDKNPILYSFSKTRFANFPTVNP